MEISELEGQEKPQFFAEFFCIKGQDLFCFFTLKSPFVCKKIVHNDVSFSFPPAEPRTNENEFRGARLRDGTTEHLRSKAEEFADGRVRFI